MKQRLCLIFRSRRVKKLRDADQKYVTSTPCVLVVDGYYFGKSLKLVLPVGWHIVGDN